MSSSGHSALTPAFQPCTYGATLQSLEGRPVAWPVLPPLRPASCQAGPLPTLVCSSPRVAHLLTLSSFVVHPTVLSTS